MLFSSLPEATPTGFRVYSANQAAKQRLHLRMSSTPGRLLITIDVHRAMVIMSIVVLALVAGLGGAAYALYPVARWAVAPVLAIGGLIIAAAFLGSRREVRIAAQRGPLADFDQTSGVLTLPSGSLKPGSVHSVECVEVRDTSLLSENRPYTVVVVVEQYKGRVVRHHQLGDAIAGSRSLANNLAHALGVPLVESRIRETHGPVPSPAR